MTNSCISAITVKNTTSNSIERGGDPVTVDGKYDSGPPVEIVANGEATFKMEANSGLAGSDGTVVYYVPYSTIYQAKVVIAWNCPYIGLNSVSCSSDNAAVTVTKGSYDSTGDLTVTVTIS